MAETRPISARVPRAVLDSARAALGLPDSSTDRDVIHHALATVAGLDVHQHRRPPGRPRRTPQEATTT